VPGGIALSAIPLETSPIGDRYSSHVSNPGVPFVDLSRALASEREELLAAADRVIRSGWLIHGTEHRSFETELARYLGVGHVIGVGNGTDALELALRAVNRDERRTVLTVANAGGYTTTAARAAGFRVGYVDVDPQTHLMDVSAAATAIDDDTFAVVITHLYGRAADVAGLRAICEPRGISVIEDCAQAIGARTVDGLVGSLADLATFSFYPTKNLGALGDGGAVATHHVELAERVRRLSQYGWADKYTSTEPGGRNSRLDELQAAVLRTRLPRVDDGNQRRRDIIARYAAAAPDGLRVLPAEGPNHAGHLCVVETADARALAENLAGVGVQTAVHYPIPDHRQPSTARSEVHLPETERLTGRILSLPCFPELTDDEVDAVARGLTAHDL